MRSVVWMALKDIKLLLRDPMAAFFIGVFPLLIGLFFGLMISGVGSGQRGKSRLAVVDQDHSPMSKLFIEKLSESEGLQVDVVDDRLAAQESVRRGERIGLVVIPERFGKTAGLMWMPPPRLQVGMDPSRAAEAAMVNGLIMQAMGALIAHRFQNPAEMMPLIGQMREQVESNTGLDPFTRQLYLAFFGTLERMMENVEQLQAIQSDQAAQDPESFRFVEIETIDVTNMEQRNSERAELRKLKSRWDISFPQAMMWAVLGCIAGFSTSIARERIGGTMMRLLVAPVTRFHLLAGKALACFLTSVGVMGLLTVVGLALGMRPSSPALLIVAVVSVSVCFVGIMMVLAVLGRTEQSVSGIGWAANLVMAMFGGAMVPVMFMPAVIQEFSVLSPIRWALLAIEGAIWRDFTAAEMLTPCAILIAIGVVAMAVGTLVLSRRS